MIDLHTSSPQKMIILQGVRHDSAVTTPTDGSDLLVEGAGPDPEKHANSACAQLNNVKNRSVGHAYASHTLFFCTELDIPGAHFHVH